MHIAVVCSGPALTNGVLIGCEETKEGAIFDVPFESLSPLIKKAEALGLSVKAIYLTHSHWDHIGDLARLKKKLGAKVFVHPLDSENVLSPGSDGLPLLMKVEGCEVDGTLEEGDEIQVGNHRAKVIHTPGHARGSLCFYFEEDGLLIAGDTLFKGSIGRLDLPTSEPDKMWISLEKLAKLPPKTRVIAGHGPETTIGEEEWLPHAKEYFGG